MECDTNPADIKVEPGTSSVESTSKLGICEVCGFRNAKYTCPKCEVKTCSLKCNKIHKLEIECDGQRDRTKFIPINKFTNLDLSSDFRLMEEISRKIEESKRKFGKKNYNIPGYLFKLKKAAQVRRITLKFLPHKFARRKANTSEYNSKNKIIYWRIDWIFVNAENLTLSDNKVPETEKLSSILSQYLVKQNDEYLQEKLQFYQAANIPGIKLYLKAELKVKNKFYELDPSLTLKECLAKKLIIEYPTIHVVLKDHGLAYNVIDSDDEQEDMEIEQRTKTGNEVIQSIVHNAEIDESLYKSLKNLLFISEYSDEDLSPAEQ